MTGEEEGKDGKSDAKPTLGGYHHTLSPGRYETSLMSRHFPVVSGCPVVV